MPEYLTPVVTQLTTMYPLIIAASIGLAMIPFAAQRGWGIFKKFK